MNSNIVLVIKKIEKLISNENFDLVLRMIVSQKNFSFIDNNSFERLAKDINIHQLVNQNELSFLIGLWIKSNTNHKVFNLKKINKNEKLKVIELFCEIVFLLKELHDSISEIESAIDVNSINELLEEQKTHKIEMLKFFFKEAFFYDIQGSYFEQLLFFVKAKYTKDEEWLIKNKGFTGNDLYLFCTTLKNAINLKKVRDNKQEIFDAVIESSQQLVFDKEYLVNLSKNSDAILNAFCYDIESNKNSNYTDITDLNNYKIFPIIKMNNNQYFIPSIYQLLDSFYETPFFWMIDDKEYKNEHLKNRGESLVEAVSTILKRKFNAKNIFKEVEIKKNKATHVTDVDLLLTHGTKAIVFQLKSKRLRMDSLEGNPDKIINDVKLAILAPIEQAKESVYALQNNSDFEFIPKNKSFLSKLNNITNYYIVTVNLDNMPALKLLSKVFITDQIKYRPLTLTIFSLDDLVGYLDKNKFFEYISNRCETDHYYIATDEESYLGYFIRNKKFMPYSDGKRYYIDQNHASILDEFRYKKMIKQDFIDAKFIK